MADSQRCCVCGEAAKALRRKHGFSRPPKLVSILARTVILVPTGDDSARLAADLTAAQANPHPVVVWLCPAHKSEHYAALKAAHEAHQVGLEAQAAAEQAAAAAHLASLQAQEGRVTRGTGGLLGAAISALSSASATLTRVTTRTKAEKIAMQKEFGTLIAYNKRHGAYELDAQAQLSSRVQTRLQARLTPGPDLPDTPSSSAQPPDVGQVGAMVELGGSNGSRTPTL
jgi:hypothetical protein